jgi:hypothetical protein
LRAFVGKFIGDFGATLQAPLVLIGERLGCTRRRKTPGR